MGCLDESFRWVPLTGQFLRPPDVALFAECVICVGPLCLVADVPAASFFVIDQGLRCGYVVAALRADDLRHALQRAPAVPTVAVSSPPPRSVARSVWVVPACLGWRW